jgi:serine phosphatase RsbU (regulator of sigma subunit)
MELNMTPDSQIRSLNETSRSSSDENLHLPGVPLFKSLPAEELSRLFGKYKTWDAPAGTLILQEGQAGDEFYVILHGQVEIVRALGSAEESILGMRQPGEFIGEIGLLNQGAPRTATARVVNDARLLTITYTDFSELLKLHPELAFELATVLSSRLAEALNETINNLRDRNEKLQQAYDDLKAAQARIIEQEKLEHSLQLARKIQYSILPVHIPQMDGFDIGALMKPAQAVGGDFFGVYPLDDQHMALIVGDVSDKGMPAAIFMAQSHALLRASIRSGVDSSNVLQLVNSLLLEMNAEDMFVTVIYGILNKTSGEFRYTRAGHELPLILDPSGNTSFHEMGKGMVLGIMENPLLEECSLTIPSGGFMLLYSDGTADGMNTDGSRFGKKGLTMVVERLGINTLAQQTCQAIFDELVDFQKGEPQFDDVTLLGVRRLSQA